MANERPASPSDWVERQLLEIVSLPSGQVDPREEPYCHWPLLAPNHIEPGSGRWTTVQTAAEQQAVSGKYVFEPNDVVYSKIRPYLRKAALVRQRGLCSADMYPLRAARELEPRYLLAVLLSEDFTQFAASCSDRTGIPKINRAELAQYRLKLPPLGEQRKIAAILASVDETIEKTEAVIAQLQVVKKAMMPELLTRGLPGRHTRFRQTPLGPVPENWEVKSLGELIARGPDNGLYRPKTDYSSGTPIVRIDSFGNGDDLPASGYQRLRLSDLDVARYRLQPNDIIINRVNSLSHLGKTAFVAGMLEATVFESNMMRVSVEQRILQPRFAFHWISSRFVQEYFVARAKRAVAQASINQSDVREVPVPIPPLDEQAAIVGSVDATAVCIRRENEFIVHLRSVKSALMSALLTGQVRVTPDEDTP